MTTLYDLKAGDEVVIEEFMGILSYRIAKVTRITPVRFLYTGEGLKTIKWRKKDGYWTGPHAGTFFSKRVYVPSPTLRVLAGGAHAN